MKQPNYVRWSTVFFIASMFALCTNLRENEINNWHLIEAAMIHDLSVRKCFPKISG